MAFFHLDDLSLWEKKRIQNLLSQNNKQWNYAVVITNMTAGCTDGGQMLSSLFFEMRNFGLTPAAGRIPRKPTI